MTYHTTRHKWRPTNITKRLRESRKIRYEKRRESPDRNHDPEQNEHTLLKYSKIDWRQPKIHCAIQAKMAASPFSRADCANAFNAWTIATRKLPKQIEPNDVVTVRKKLLWTLLSQQPTGESSGSNHHDPTVPAMQTWIEFFFIYFIDTYCRTR